VEEHDRLHRLGALRLEISKRSARLARRHARLEVELLVALAADLGDKLDTLGRRLDGFATSAAPDGARRPSDAGAVDEVREIRLALLEALGDLGASLARRLDALAGQVRDLVTNPHPTEPRRSDFPEDLPPLVPTFPTPPGDSPARDGEWETIVFGGELARDGSVAADRAALLADLRRGVPAAGALAGRLLVFHAAPDAQKAASLKELGEALYRWRPKGPGPEHPLELALAAWLERACEAAGTKRKILPVRVGSRFNAAYHRTATADRGGEVAEVFGWVVLREDGTVYQKAEVGVR
jgi:hypothetical protein